MADEEKPVETVPTWGYSKDDAQIFELKKGEKLPKGYQDTPVKATKNAD